jgi:hypothetical protein
VQTLELVTAPTTSIATTIAELTDEQKVQNTKSVLGDLDMFD